VQVLSAQSRREWRGCPLYNQCHWSAAGALSFGARGAHKLQKVGTKTWIEAAQTYQRLYHLCWLFNLGYIGAFVVLAIGVGIASANNWDAFAGALFLLYLPISCILGLGIFITWLNLRGFPCPRCGERFS
jgi:hypothetical protein